MDESDDNNLVSEDENVAIRDWGYNRTTFYDHDLQDIDLLENDEDAMAMAKLEEREMEEYRDRIHSDLSPEDFDFFNFWKSPQNEDKNSTQNEYMDEKEKNESNDLLNFELPNGLDRHFLQVVFIREQLKNKIHDNKSSSTMNSIIKFIELNLIFYQYMILKYRNMNFLENLFNHPVVNTLLELFKHYYLYTNNNILNEPIYLELNNDKIDEEKNIKKVTKRKSQMLPNSFKDDDLDPMSYYNLVKTRKRAAAFNNNNEVNFDDDNSARPINYQIEKNKGLTKRSKREYKNPRVKHKIKYKKATIKHKSMVRPIRSRDSKYGGESRGINDKVVHSVKFK